MSEAVEILKRIEVKIEEMGNRIVAAIEANKKGATKKAPLSNADRNGNIFRSEDHPLVVIWNAQKPTNLQRVCGMSATSSRFKNADARWKEKPDAGYWTTVIARIGRSKFCLGDNERAWLADFEFLVRPDNHYRILEGKFDNCHASFAKTETKTSKVILGYTQDGTPVIG